MNMAWTWRESIKHQLFDCTMIVGLRDRLRCPKCKAVGTWKPHGGWLDNAVARWTDFKATLNPGVPFATSRRWVCKYCGFTRDSIGERYGAPNKVKGVWDVRGPDSAPTPKDAVEQVCGAAWPWNG